METTFEVWIESYDGVCIVLERGPNNELCFLKEEEAINWAKKRRETYPNLHFKVVSEEGFRGKREFIFSTKEK